MDTVALNALLDALGRLPGMLVWGYFWSKTLDVRSGKAHWAIWLGAWALTSVAMPVYGGDTAVGIVLTFLYMIVYPLCISRAKIGYRVLVTVATAVVVMLSEMSVMSFSFLLGFNIPEEFRNVLDHPLLYAVCETFLAAFLIIAFYFLYVLFSKMAKRPTNPLLRFFSMGLTAQLALTCIMLAVGQWVTWGEGPVVVASCLFAVVNIVADALILLSVARADEAYGQRMRAEALRVQLDASLAHFKGLADEIQSVAHFRHDLRDELQAVAALVRGGDYARAEALVGELGERLGGGRATEGGAR